MESLREYNRKRRFDQTAEPPGQVEEHKDKRLRFVVQHHIASRDHYDFRLEWDGVLKSWAVPKGPSYDPHDKRLAVHVEDHPLEYRHFEGTIPKGEYGGGVVMVWDDGEWFPLGDVDEGLAKGSLKFRLQGERLKGAWALVRMKPRDGEKGDNWLLIKERDEYTGDFDIKAVDTSVKTGRSMAEIEAGKKSPISADGKTNGTTGSKNNSVTGNKRTRATGGKERSGKENSAGKAGDKNAGKQNSAVPVAVQSVKLDRPADAVTITNPGKVFYPDSGITKGDVAAYYRKVAKRMLPYLEERILSAVRCPGGIETACFYKKHPNDNRGVVAVPVVMSDGETEDYFYVPDAYGLLYEVQMNTLEFHTWASRVQSLEQPDIMVFDLDPDEGLDLERVRQGVRDIKSLLDQLELVSYLKTSGGKGYHVVIPFRASAGWDEFREFARNTALAMEAHWPERYTSNMRKNRRSNRIFIDWVRNGRGATSIAPYSVRAREGAPVSMPITWKELDTVAPDGVSMQDAIKRLRRKDPWADFFSTQQRLRPQEG